MSDHAEETKRAMVKWKRDVIYGIALEVVCVLCYFGTRNLPTLPIFKYFLLKRRCLC